MFIVSLLAGLGCLSAGKNTPSLLLLGFVAPTTAMAFSGDTEVTVSCLSTALVPGFAVIFMLNEGSLVLIPLSI